MTPPDCVTRLSARYQPARPGRVSGNTSAVYAPGRVPVPLEFDTETAYGIKEGVRAGVTPVIVVGPVTRKLVMGTPPMVAPVAPMKLLPVIVTGTPPVAIPAGGAMLETL